jgi:hypothetical protein
MPPLSEFAEAYAEALRDLGDSVERHKLKLLRDLAQENVDEASNVVLVLKQHLLRVRSAVRDSFADMLSLLAGLRECRVGLELQGRLPTLLSRPCFCRCLCNGHCQRCTCWTLF